MKKYILILSLIAAFSCQDKNEKDIDTLVENKNLNEIKARKQQLNQEKQALDEKIQKLDGVLKKLDSSQNRPLVTVKKLKDTTFKHYVEVQGNVETDQNIVIYPEYSGILTKVYVEEGEQVKKGQLLAKIEENGISSQLAEVQTKLNLAKTTYERRKKLWDKNIGSEMQYLKAKANYEGMQKSVQQLKTQLSKTKVRAPFSGTIDNIITDQGGLVNQGQSQLFRIVNLEKMYVSADVPENYLNNIKKGSEVRVEIASIGKTFEGKVRQVSSFINPNNRTFEVKVSVPNKNGMVKPNQNAKIKVNDFTSENTIVISENLLKEDASGNRMAFKVKKKNDSLGKAVKTKVKTGRSYENQIEITEGLKAGDFIIVDGVRTIRDGHEVKIKQ
jgi:RND family efflux transporter MFP subunit